MHPIPLEKLPPVKIAALRALAERQMRYVPDVGWLQLGVDDERLAFNSHTILWLGMVGWARVFAGHTATISTDGLKVLRMIDARRAA